MRTMYRKSSFTPSSFFGPRAALGSSFSSSFFFPPRSTLSSSARTCGPCGSGLGFSSGIDEIPGWDGHPNFRTYLRIRSARPEVRVLEDQSGVVDQDFDRVSGVEIFESVSSWPVRSPVDRGAASGPSVAIRHRSSGLRDLQRLAHRNRIFLVSRGSVEGHEQPDEAPGIVRANDPDPDSRRAWCRGHRYAPDLIDRRTL